MTIAPYLAGLVRGLTPYIVHRVRAPAQPPSGMTDEGDRRVPEPGVWRPGAGAAGKRQGASAVGIAEFRDFRIGRARALEGYRTLVLNADLQPLSWAPLSSWTWQEAMTAVLQERVVQLKAYDEVTIRSAHAEFEVPAVVCLRQYHRRKAVAFTRFNLFLRDELRCQYCGTEEPAKNLTFDHVIPRSRGGKGGFRNIVASCQRCNLRKGNRTPAEAGLKLLRQPRVPSPQELDRIGRRLAFMHKDLHQSWLDFLYWDSELAE